VRTPPQLPLASLLLLACGTTTSKPIVEFPTQAALNAIGARPAAPVVLKTADVPVATWTIPGADTARTLFEPWAATSEGERTLAALVAGGKPVRFTKAMSCVARELGRYYAETRSTPPERLHAFILGACGTIARDVALVPFGGEVPAGTADSAVLAAWREGLRKAVAEHLPGDATEVGLWFGRVNKMVLAVVAFDRLKVNVKPFSLVPADGGEVVIEGEVPGPVEYVEGNINQGRYLADSCFTDPTVPRPRFRIICHLAEGDPVAWVDLLYAEPHRVLAHPFARFLARRDPLAELAHRPEPYGEPQPVTSPEAFNRTVIEQLNAVRRLAELPPLKLAALQSATAGNLAGHYFAAVTEGKDADVVDTIALGMMAGWQVGGMIRDASFASVLVPYTNDAGRWLTDVLATPLGRTALMDPQIEEIALGPTVMSKPDGLGALVAGYRFHHGNNHTSDMRRLLMRVAAARKRMSLAPPARIAQVEEAMNGILAQVNQGQMQPSEALEEVLQEGVARMGAGMRGYLVEATSLNAVEIPQEILAQPTLHLAVGVTHFKPPGAAWAQLVILVVFVDYPANGA
jgi:hypothetical protein